MTAMGIDVSNRQGSIDWPSVAASGIQFAMLKATEGTSFTDAYLVSNLRDAAAAGVAPGVYHFARPALNDPEPEAQHFLAVAQPSLRPGYPVALDLEADPDGRPLPADCGAWAVQWITLVQQALGCLPLLYTNLDLIQHNGLGIPALAACGLWLAAPQATMPPPPPPWAFIALWQNFWTGSVAGIRGSVDLDVFNADISRWPLYGLPAPAPRRGMTNDDWTQAQRIMLAAEQLNPAATIAFLQQFAAEA